MKKGIFFNINQYVHKKNTTYKIRNISQIGKIIYELNYNSSPIKLNITVKTLKRNKNNWDVKWLNCLHLLE